jgi:uncharacterized protein
VTPAAQPSGVSHREARHHSHFQGMDELPLPIEIRVSPIHGLGAFARTAISKGSRVVEYLGERITRAESLKRCEAGNQFIFGLSETEDLDGSVEHNLARFMNHSCAPNCEALFEAGRIWLVAIGDIAAGEEITFNYSYDLDDYRKHPCQCGASECVKFIVAAEFFETLKRQRQFHLSSDLD